MIPKRIHLCWLSGDPYPPKIRRCLESWKRHLPDYEIVLWDRKRFDLDTVPWVAQAFAAKKYAFAADYIRMYALYNYGGIYLDSDVEVLRSFDPLLDLPYFAGVESAGTIEAAVLGAEKGCDWIKWCLDYYEGRQFRKEDGSFDIRMLPEIMNETIGRRRKIVKVEEGGGSDALARLKRLDTAEAVYVLPQEYFSPKLFDSREVQLTPRTYAIHHYRNSWFSHKAFWYYRLRTVLIRIFGYKFIRAVERRLLKR